MVELLLGAFPVHELEIVDQQDVDRAELLLERERILAAKSLHELIAEAFRRQVEHLRVRGPALHLPCDGMQKMRLAETNRRVDIERIEPLGVAERRIGDLRGTRVRHPVRGPDDEALECIARIERRAFKAAHVRPANRRRAGDDAGRTMAILGVARTRAVDGLLARAVRLAVA